MRRLLGTVFGGSPELLLTHLVAERGVGEAELRRMRALLDARLGETTTADADAAGPGAAGPGAGEAADVAGEET
jgi:hypothetical protein